MWNSRHLKLSYNMENQNNLLEEVGVPKTSQEKSIPQGN